LAHDLKPPATTKPRLYRPFILWCACFLSAWVALVVVGQHTSHVAANWPIAVAMALGSYLSGSTPIGGGAVGYPVLVLLFEHPASMGRQFSFVVQSVGMTSATIYILCSGRAIAWRLLLGAVGVGSVALPLTLTLLTPRIPDTAITLIFATVWGSFGVLTLTKLRMLLADREQPRLGARTDLITGCCVGLIGGVATGLTGIGVNMVLYTALVLLYRADLRVAISTSVIAMACLSVVGTLTSAAQGSLTEDVYHAWLAAAPIVLFGAPLGALAMTLIPRKPTMIIIASLCLMQLFWAIWRVGPSAGVLIGAGAGLLAANLVFHLLFKQGQRLAAQPEAQPRL
jgi:uncharacterized membrane protein YfcA